MFTVTFFGFAVPIGSKKQAQKKTAGAGGFFANCAQFRKSVERSPHTARVDWRKIVCKAIAAG
jgi:hypothetical protein